MAEIKKTDNDILFPVIEETVKSGTDVKLKVSGTSMYPLVGSRRDSVLLTKAEKLKVGDVPLYKRDNGKIVLHRIVEIRDGAYGMRGDFEQKIEFPIHKDQIIAVAKGFYRHEHFISCESFWYKVYKSFWMHTVAIRPLLIKILKLRGVKKAKKS